MVWTAVFNFLIMACLFPFFVDGTPVPCGKCPTCLVRRSNGWAFRVMQEEKTACSAMWIRLSYDDVHLPVTKSRLPTLVKRDVQLFIKRLRWLQHGEFPKCSEPVGFQRFNYLGHGKVIQRRCNKCVNCRAYLSIPKIKYFACGEYGTRFCRPHYHVLLLNADERFLTEAWSDEFGQIGDIYIDPRPVTEGAVAYTMGYTMKQKNVRLGHYDDREHEFLLMSKGLGLSYLSDDVIAWHRANPSRSYVVLPGGSKTALPRYYADRIFNVSDALTGENIKDVRAPLMDSAAKRAHQRAYDEHIRVYGNADDYIRTQNERRHMAIFNFQKKGSARD